MNTIDFAVIFKALSDSHRLQIAEMLAAEGELCACKILERFAISQPTLSHHMNVLCECQLVSARKEGRWSYYSLNRQLVAQLSRYLDAWQKQ